MASYDSKNMKDYQNQTMKEVKNEINEKIDQNPKSEKDINTLIILSMCNDWNTASPHNSRSDDKKLSEKTKQRIDDAISKYIKNQKIKEGENFPESKEYSLLHWAA
jgi:hypothetical protein